ncbi:MAG: 2-hydroxyacyl-CoA dehydratase [Candidatus Rokubacteria bacterium]|nr:2-hydroxyacyl-CoA dehydratase [Candidatus Rokubacteria bacterium]
MWDEQEPGGPDRRGRPRLRRRRDGVDGLRHQPAHLRCLGASEGVPQPLARPRSHEARRGRGRLLHERAQTPRGRAREGVGHARHRRRAPDVDRAGTRVTDDGLRTSIALFNENRSLLRRFSEARRTAGVRAEDAVYVVASALTAPVEEHNALMKQLLASLAPARPTSESSRTEPKLMLCALNIPMAVDVIRMAEKYGATVVADDFTSSPRYGSTEVEADGDPFRALARAYLRAVPAPGLSSFEDRAVRIRDAMEGAGARGLIYLIQLYCDVYAFEYAILKERFDRWNLPHLRLEAEATPSSVEQLNVRVQSFVESLL